MIKKMKNFFVRGLQHMGDNELQAWKKSVHHYDVTLQYL